MAITLTDEPFQFEWVRAGLSLRTVSAMAELPEHLKSAGELATGVVAPGPLTASYVGFMAGLVSAAEPQTAGHRRLEEVVLELQHAVLSEAVLSRPARGGTQELRLRILEYIERHFADRLLTPPTIAKALNVSLRAVHLAFTNEPWTVAQFVRHRRVQAAAGALKYDSVQPTRADLVHRFGFGGPDTMRRAFIAEFGQSIEQYVREHRPDNADHD